MTLDSLERMCDKAVCSGRKGLDECENRTNFEFRFRLPHLSQGRWPALVGSFTNRRRPCLGLTPGRGFSFPEPQMYVPWSAEQNQGLAVSPASKRRVNARSRASAAIQQIAQAGFSPYGCKPPSLSGIGLTGGRGGMQGLCSDSQNQSFQALTRCFKATASTQPDTQVQFKGGCE